MRKIGPMNTPRFCLPRVYRPSRCRCVLQRFSLACENTSHQNVFSLFVISRNSILALLGASDYLTTFVKGGLPYTQFLLILQRKQVWAPHRWPFQTYQLSRYSRITAIMHIFLFTGHLADWGRGKHKLGAAARIAFQSAFMNTSSP